MAKYYDADGNEVEAFTAEELKTHPDFVKLQKDVEDAQKKLDESGNASEGQKKRLKEERDNAVKAFEEYKSNTDTRFNQLEEKLISGTKAKVMANFSKGNKELAEKLDVKYQSLMKTGEYQTDEEGISRAMADAYTLVNGSKPSPSIMNNITSAGDRGDGASGNQSGKVEFTENGKGMGKMLGITDEDIKKYGDKIK